MSEDVAASTPSAPASSSARVRARLARFGGARSGTGNPVLEPLLQTVRATHPRADLGIIERAYEVAERAHRGQLRKSGDAYITHPLAVATILAELGMTPATLAAALLHDTVEDTAYGLGQLEKDFGREVAMLVDGVTKLDKVTYGDAAQAETVRKMVVAMAKDIRVLVIKLADRLHNARTWRYVSVESAQRKARETLEIYAPLAHRLGMNTIKWELEDLSFATLYPKVYDEIVRLVAERAPAREEYLAGVREQVSSDLKAAKIKATVTGRPKHYYSVYQKMIVRGRDFEDIYDLVAVRVLVDSVRDCYAALGALHARWNPLPGRFKDYIAMPKFNMYQSLHTTVIGPQGKPVEIQIRTHTMHRRAEYGVAAHWKYKEDATAPGPDAKDGDSGPINDMAWLRQLLDWQKETADPGEFLDSLRFEINAREVYVFTPKGEVVALPGRVHPGGLRLRGPHRGRPPLHRRAGQRPARAAGVDARERRRRRGLDLQGRRRRALPRLADVRPDAAGAQQDPQWFSKERREEMIEHGKDAIAKAMRKQGLPLQRLMSATRSPASRESCGLPDIDALYAAVGEAMSPPSTWWEGSWPPSAARRASEDLAEATTPTAGRSGRSEDPGVVVDGRRRVGQAGAAARPCPATRSWASSPAATACRCTAATAPTSRPWSASPTGSSRSWAPRRPACSSWRSRSRPSTAPAALGRHPRALRPARQHPVRLGQTSRTAWPSRRFTFEMGDPATSTTS